MLEARGLTKRFGSRLAVDKLSFDVRPGLVTGFLGPNGSGKSTTMRLILGLDHPDAGQARIGGRRYADLGWPLREVGALLEARANATAREGTAARSSRRGRPAAARGCSAAPRRRAARPVARELRPEEEGAPPCGGAPSS